VEQVIAAGAWAPNHHKTEPWRFVVLAGKARQELGDEMAEDLRATLDDPGSEGSRSLLDKERNKPLRAPVVVAVAAMPPSHPKALMIEEIQATAAAVQNMLLAAGAVGLGAMWRTGRAAYSDAVKRFLGLPTDAHIVAFVYLGYPDLPPLPDRERNATKHTAWLGWDE
jgi:nitroreductase